MANIIMSYKNAHVRGVPAFEVMDLYTDSNLLAGAEPAVQGPRRILLGDSLTLAPFSVVGLSSGKLVMATYNATLSSAIKPIGVLLHGATSGSSNTTVFGEVLLTGNFNAGVNDTGDDSPLVWHASFDTLAKKTTWEGVVGNPLLVFRQRRIV
ncbi:hypothetical protein [Sphingobium lignivorans]|uniref:Uncharacterized protein n=1 Tax=Sphingobium lignivorans TaxID=2735886 RepID=A0ABR6NFS7_9SPHN|nr:hypothetical protein [Sphingobium lignivorans]MBB5985926.1 hypothetical protein [Sphingobium lignivorans]